MEPPREGEVHEFERTLTAEDVRRFADVSRDTQPRHTDPGDGERPMVHGLLTATLPTKIGGDPEVLARRMELEFVRPVYAGETVACTWEDETVADRGDRYEVTAAVTCENGDGEVVLRGEIDGVVRKTG